jgi:hypothetical protein
MKNPCIVTYFMGNILDKTPEMQKKVVDKFNKSKIPFYQVKGMPSHAQFIDYFWTVNGAGPEYMKESGVKQELDHDVVLILDIDCIPLSEKAIEYYIEQASNGKVIGNVQRSNHIKNDQHLFAAPSAIALSKETYINIGKPPALETERSDVAEEYTWAAEAKNVPVELILPVSFDKAPHKYGWEEDQRPFWALKDDMPVYGIGTTFGNQEFGDMYYHNFQIAHPGNQEMFWARCEKALNA